MVDNNFIHTDEDVFQSDDRHIQMNSVNDLPTPENVRMQLEMSVTPTAACYQLLYDKLLKRFQAENEAVVHNQYLKLQNSLLLRLLRKTERLRLYPTCEIVPTDAAPSSEFLNPSESNDTGNSISQALHLSSIRRVPGPRQEVVSILLRNQEIESGRASNNGDCTDNPGQPSKQNQVTVESGFFLQELSDLRDAVAVLESEFNFKSNALRERISKIKNDRDLLRRIVNDSLKLAKENRALNSSLNLISEKIFQRTIQNMASEKRNAMLRRKVEFLSCTCNALEKERNRLRNEMLLLDESLEQYLTKKLSRLDLSIMKRRERFYEDVRAAISGMCNSVNVKQSSNQVIKSPFHLYNTEQNSVCLPPPHTNAESFRTGHIRNITLEKSNDSAETTEVTSTTPNSQNTNHCHTKPEFEQENLEKLISSHSGSGSLIFDPAGNDQARKFVPIENKDLDINWGPCTGSIQEDSQTIANVSDHQSDGIGCALISDGNNLGNKDDLNVSTISSIEKATTHEGHNLALVLETRRNEFPERMQEDQLLSPVTPSHEGSSVDKIVADLDHTYAKNAYGDLEHISKRSALDKLREAETGSSVHSGSHKSKDLATDCNTSQVKPEEQNFQSIERNNELMMFGSTQSETENEELESKLGKSLNDSKLDAHFGSKDTVSKPATKWEDRSGASAYDGVSKEKHSYSVLPRPYNPSITYETDGREESNESFQDDADWRDNEDPAESVSDSEGDYNQDATDLISEDDFDEYVPVSNSNNSSEFSAEKDRRIRENAMNVEVSELNASKISTEAPDTIFHMKGSSMLNNCRSKLIISSAGLNVKSSTKTPNIESSHTLPTKTALSKIQDQSRTGPVRAENDNTITVVPDSSSENALAGQSNSKLKISRSGSQLGRDAMTAMKRKSQSCRFLEHGCYDPVIEVKGSSEHGMTSHKLNCAKQDEHCNRQTIEGNTEISSSEQRSSKTRQIENDFSSQMRPEIQDETKIHSNFYHIAIDSRNGSSSLQLKSQRLNSDISDDQISGVDCSGAHCSELSQLQRAAQSKTSAPNSAHSLASRNTGKLDKAVSNKRKENERGKEKWFRWNKIL